MTVTCEIAPDVPCVCITRDNFEEHLTAGCLLYGYGSIPSRDTVLDSGISQAVTAVAGTVSNALEQCFQDVQAYNEPQYVADVIAKALRSASNDLFELSHLSGQGIYVGGIVAYFSKMHYVATAFGGASLMCFTDGHLLDLYEIDRKSLIYDAIGSRKGWAGKFRQGTLPECGLLLGATELPHDHSRCEKLLAEYMAPGIHVNSGAAIIRQALPPNSMTAAIEFRANEKGGAACDTPQKETV